MARRGKKSIKWGEGILAENLTRRSKREDIDKRFNALFDIYGIEIYGSKTEDYVLALERLVFCLARELNIQGCMSKLTSEPLAQEYKEYIYWKVIKNSSQKIKKSIELTIDFLEKMIIRQNKDNIIEFLDFVFVEDIDIVIEIIDEMSKIKDISSYYFRMQRKNRKIQKERKENYNHNLHDICSHYPAYKLLGEMEKNFIKYLYDGSIKTGN